MFLIAPTSQTYLSFISMLGCVRLAPRGYVPEGSTLSIVCLPAAEQAHTMFLCELFPWLLSVTDRSARLRALSHRWFLTHTVHTARYRRRTQKSNTKYVWLVIASTVIAAPLLFGDTNTVLVVFP